MEPEPIVHARGFPGWGPPTMCGEGQPSTESPAVITCEVCCDILGDPAKLVAQVAELERTIGKPTLRGAPVRRIP